MKKFVKASALVLALTGPALVSQGANAWWAPVDGPWNSGPWNGPGWGPGWGNGPGWGGYGPGWGYGPYGPGWGNGYAPGWGGGPYYGPGYGWGPRHMQPPAAPATDDNNND